MKNIRQIINSSDPENRVAISNAWNLSDKTLYGFSLELTSQSWEYPELNVQDILDQVAYAE